VRDASPLFFRKTPSIASSRRARHAVCQWLAGLVGRACDAGSRTTNNGAVPSARVCQRVSPDHRGERGVDTTSLSPRSASASLVAALVAILVVVTKQRQVDGIGHGPVAEIVRRHVIAAAIRRLSLPETRSPGTTVRRHATAVLKVGPETSRTRGNGLPEGAAIRVRRRGDAEKRRAVGEVERDGQAARRS
jgi:hypothetical protein